MRHTCRILLVLACVLLVAARAAAVTVGESLDQLVGEKGRPLGKVVVGDAIILTYADVVVKISAGKVVSVKPAPAAHQPAPLSPEARDAVGAAQTLAQTADKIRVLQNREKEAVTRVIEIINAPVEAIPVEPGMNIGVFGSGWFDANCPIPDFDHVDVSQT
jgi:hypothetical protein